MKGENHMRYSRRKHSTESREILCAAIKGIAVAAVIMAVFFGGKAAGRREILRSEMWTDCNGTIYIDTLYNGVIAHENLAESVYSRR
jgi:predicted membrane protein